MIFLNVISLIFSLFAMVVSYRNIIFISKVIKVLHNEKEG